MKLASQIAVGPGVTLGLGADYWVDQHFALGVMARLTSGAAIDDQADSEYVHGLVTPALLMTACYNDYLVSPSSSPGGASWLPWRRSVYPTVSRTSAATTSSAPPAST